MSRYGGYHYIGDKNHCKKATEICYQVYRSQSKSYEIISHLLSRNILCTGTSGDWT